MDNLRVCYDTLEANKATGSGWRNKVSGHLSYYAITDNLERCRCYVFRATHIVFKWLNRKSQRKAYTWKRFEQALAWVAQIQTPQRPEPVS